MDAGEIEGKVREDFSFLIDNSSVLGILIYGSMAKGESDERSDIDICIVAPSVEDKIRFSRTILANVRDERYDVRVFELMPLYLKIEVIEHGKVVYARDIYELYEYFYMFRKLWEDQKERQTLSKDEILDLFAPKIE
ncbi:MAG: nucleotidyltransferase domain-containing protein [Candidatus Methanospirare jalkutatii]|nr:nucleotidyltransferase domain-containing protein [Candidatus Methanospirare jalkutatii]